MGTDNFDSLFDRHYDRLVRYVRGIDRRFSVEDARDLAQDAFVKSMKHLPEVAVPAQWSYLKRAAYSCAHNEIHRERAIREESLTEDPENAIDPACERPRIDELLARRQETAAIQARMQQALLALPELSRLCVIGRIRGASYEELCEKLDLTPVAARSRFKRGVDQLREEIGTTPDWFEWPDAFEEDAHDE